jgi:hypothetical protein
MPKLFIIKKKDYNRLVALAAIAISFADLINTPATTSDEKRSAEIQVIVAVKPLQAKIKTSEIVSDLDDYYYDFFPGDE